MKNLFLLTITICCSIFGYGQTTLSAGDIAITGFNSDNHDQFSFVLLVDILATTEIKFTDKGWVDTGHFRVGGEGILVWTATTDLSCGTEIVVIDHGPFSTSLGSITDSNDFLLDIDGDQLSAFQGHESSPTFLYAIHFASETGWTNATTEQTSAIPSGLSNGTNAIYFGNFDNGTYDCIITSSQPLILAAISTVYNWTTSDNRLTLGGCSYICATCPYTTTWSGVWSPSPPTISDTVVIDADYDTGIDGDIIACSLTVNPNSTLNVSDDSFIGIENDIVVNGNGAIMVSKNGTVIQSNSAATTTISDATNGVVKITKETASIDAWYEYTYWSSPVSGETIEDTFFNTNADRRYLFNAANYKDSFAEFNNDNDTTTPGQDDVDDDANDWQLVNAIDVMQPGVGYAATLSPASFTSVGIGYPHTFEGPFNNGMYNVPVYRNDAESSDSNWNLIGNPYPSAIDIDAFFDENNYNSITTSGTIDGAVYLWSQDAAPDDDNNGNSDQNFNSADYATINGAGEIMGGDRVMPNRYISSGQGFFLNYHNDGDVVSSSTNGDGDLISVGNVIFDNRMRVIGNNDQLFKVTNPLNNKLWLNLTSDNGVFSQVLIAYVAGATDGNDGSYFDTKRNISTGMAAFIYSSIEGYDEKFSIQGKATESISHDEIINLGLYTAIVVPTLYTISIAQLEGDFLNANTAYLIDDIMNTVHDLSANDYTFTSDSGDFNDRFKIVFDINSLSTETFETSPDSVSIVQLENDVIKFIVPNDLAIKSINIHDLLGQQLYHLKGSNGNVEIFTLSNLSQTAYIVQIGLTNGQTISKKVIKK